MTDTPPDKSPLLGVDWLKAVAGALAAVSTTVLLSTLGAAGTLIGAALGSIAATIATAIYSQGLDRSRARVRQLSGLAAGTVRVPGAPAERPERAASEGVDRVGWLDRLRGLRWGRVALGAVAMFVVVIAAVTAFELSSGRPLASAVGGGDGGGTTLSRVTESGTGGGSGDHTPAPSGDADPSDGPGTPTSSPTSSPTPTDEPSASPSSEPSASSSPSAQTSPTPTESTDPTPTAGGSPSAGPADAPPAE